MHGGFQVGAGSAARDAEQRNRESPQIGRAQVGIRLTRAVGQKFEFEAAPGKQAGEARPSVATPASQRPAEQPVAEPTPSSPAARVWKKFRSLFGFK
jgi:hypothetical protein